MTVNDLIEYSSSTSVWFNYMLTAIAIGVAGIVTVALIAYYKKANIRGVLTWAGAVAVTLFMTTLVSGLFVSFDLREKEEEAVAANAQTFKEWAEPTYGITISDKDAERVMGSVGSGWTMWVNASAGLSFDAESADGTVELELKEKADGSFSLVQTGAELKAVDGR